MLAAELMAQVRRVQIKARRAVRSRLAGDYHSAFKGSGLNFEDVREYMPGDDIRAIDWNVSARTDKPFIKRYIEERELTVLLAVDLSASLNFGSTSTTKRAIAAEVAALIALAALANGDRVGFLGFTDRIERYLRPGKGSHQAARVVSDILSFIPVGTKTDLTAACVELTRLHRRRAVVFLISDFQTRGFHPALTRAARLHDVCCIAIGDPYEHELPHRGRWRVRDPESGIVKIVDTNRLTSRVPTDLTSLRRCGTSTIDLSTRGGHLNTVAKYFAKLARSEGRR